MFEIDAQDIPFVQTHRALLLLDLQNDFLSPEAVLPVNNPPQLLEGVVDLVNRFRSFGEVVWVRSTFRKSRPVNSPYGASERVITESDLPKKELKNAQKQKVRPMPQSADGQDTEGLGSVKSEGGGKNDEVLPNPEAFLTLEPGQSPSVVVYGSPGANFAPLACDALETRRDTVFEKSYYSAFKDGHLVQVLRGKFVTELYLCGISTNISVFATAMDAARHGYAITLIDDCLGYRSKALHDESIRQLVEFTGCDVLCRHDVLDNLKALSKTKKQSPWTMPQTRPTDRRKPDPSRPKNPPTVSIGSDLETAMANLKLKPETEIDDDGDAIDLPEDLIRLTMKNVNGDAPNPRERVKSKVKTRKRQKSLPKETEPSRPSAQLGMKPPHSPTSDIMHATSLALEKLALKDDGTTESEVTRSVEPTTVDTEELVPRMKEVPALEPDSASRASSEEPVLPPPGVEAYEAPPKPFKKRVPTPICEGDMTVIEYALDDAIPSNIFEKVRDEVRWQKMSHHGGEVPRLVAVQGEIKADGSSPIYRHPADESPTLLPWSPTVSAIKKQVEKHLGHSVNHVLIQFYRDGTDYISEHSDKTLDIDPESYIANVSLGAQRTMVLRTKRLETAAKPSNSKPAAPRDSIRVSLPHRSLVKMGLKTNMRWLHGIRQDKRMQSEKSEAELAYEGGRISLTFRLIGTFLDRDNQRIWGIGAIGKTQKEAGDVVNGDTPEAENMIKAFGRENHASDFDRERYYGEGFNVLHISNTPRLFLSGDDVSDLRVKLALTAYDISWVDGEISPHFNWKGGQTGNNAPAVPRKLPVKFVDNDAGKTCVIGDMAILLYIDTVYGPNHHAKPLSNANLARQFSRMQYTNVLLEKWRAVPFSVRPFRCEMELWDVFAQEGPFIAGSGYSLADIALLPVLNEIAKEWSNCAGLNTLSNYYERMLERESVKKLSLTPCAQKVELRKQEAVAAALKKEKPAKPTGGIRGSPKTA